MINNSDKDNFFVIFASSKGVLAERLGMGLQNLVQRFESARRLWNPQSLLIGDFLFLKTNAQLISRAFVSINLNLNYGCFIKTILLGPKYGEVSQSSSTKNSVGPYSSSERIQCNLPDVETPFTVLLAVSYPNSK